MAIDKIFNDANVDGIADNIFGAVNNSVSEVKQMQQRKAAENVQMVVEAFKKIETNITEKFDNVTDVIEKRVLTIKDGRDGSSGSDGRNGRDGKPGRDGVNGKQGPPGTPGKDGTDGVDGVSVTDASIDFDGSLVISLSSGQQINVGEVVPPELERQLVELRQGGGGAAVSSGDVTGPAASTDNAIVRFDGTTGKVVQNSVVTIADTTGNMAGVGSLTVGTTLGVTGVATFSAGTNLLPALTTTGDPNTGIFFPAADKLGFTTGGGTDQMVLDSAGNLGIGTSSPSTFGKLAVYGNGTAPTVFLALGNDTPTSGATLANIFFGARTNGVTNALIRAIANDNGNGTDGQLTFWTSDNTTGPGPLVEVVRFSSDGTFRVKGAGTAGSTDAVQFSGSAPASSLILNSSGNLAVTGTLSASGLVTASANALIGSGTVQAWSGPVAKFGSKTYVGQLNTNAGAYLSNNLYYDGSNWRTEAAATGGFISVIGNTFAFEVAASGGVLGSVSPATVFTANTTALALGVGISLTGGTSGTGYSFSGSAPATSLTLDSSGNLLVGQTSVSTTTAGAALQQSQGSGKWAFNISGASSSSSEYAHYVYSTTAAAYRFLVNYAGTIFATSITITAISDERLKENVRNLETGLDAIVALKPRRFDWKEGKGQDKKNVAGFIAQEFEEVFPECVSTSKAGGDGIEYKNINHETLIPTLVKAVQEQQALITQLTARVAQLESKP